MLRPISVLMIIVGTIFTVGYFLVMSALEDERGQAINEERVTGTVLSTNTAEFHGRYSGKSVMHTGLVSLPNGRKTMLHFPTKPAVGAGVEIKLVEYENGDFSAFRLSALDY